MLGREMLVKQGVDKDGILRSRYNGGAESYLPTTYRVNHARALRNWITAICLQYGLQVTRRKGEAILRSSCLG